MSVSTSYGHAGSGAYVKECRKETIACGTAKANAWQKLVGTVACQAFELGGVAFEIET